MLRALDAEGPLGVRRLARSLATDPMNAKHVADRLEAGGLVASEADPTDRRTRRLRPTQRGSELATELRARAGEQEDWMREVLGADGTEALVEALVSLERAAGLSGGASAWDARHRERPFSTDPDPLVLDAVADVSPGRALDLGSGPGRNSLALAARGWMVTAVDFSEVALEQLREAAATDGLDIQTVREDILAYRPPADSFELALLANVHLPKRELRSVLERATAALVPGGRLLAIGHHREGPHRHGPMRPELLFTEERLQEVLPARMHMERLARHRRERGGDRGADLSLLMEATRVG